MILCGRCKAHHATVADVRLCHTGAVDRLLPTPAPAPQDDQPCGVYGRSSADRASLSERPPSERSPEPPAPVRWSVAEIPQGCYSILESGKVRFFKVTRPTEGRWRGYIFVTEQAGDEHFPIRDRVRREAILLTIAADPQSASKAYGHLLGQCGVCGRTLTDENSRAAGIGPVCAEKTGWKS